MRKKTMLIALVMVATAGPALAASHGLGGTVAAGKSYLAGQGCWTSVAFGGHLPDAAPDYVGNLMRPCIGA